MRTFHIGGAASRATAQDNIQVMNDGTVRLHNVKVVGKADGTSLVAVTAFGITTATNYAISGLVDWPLAALFVIGGAGGGFLGMLLGKLLGKSRNGLRYTFAGLVIIVGGGIIWQGLSFLSWI